ncbi:MAG: site-2 protease family protein [Chloroflexi bacterium]|nr:site-2 protease family protein [Chloroflexota bacterium]
MKQIMGGGFYLGRIFGIQFHLHYSWFIIFILITVSMSWQYFPVIYPGWNIAVYWITGISASLLFFSSVVAHELAHSLVGRANNIPVKSITLFIFGGVAHMTREAKHHGAEFKMAIAGPLSSLTIGGIFYVLHLLFGGINEPVAAITSWLAQVNVVLAVFNLIPGFPLDGGRIFRSILWRFSGDYQRATRIATNVGRGVGYLFILGGIALVFRFPGQWYSGLWLALIGWFLSYIAAVSYRQSRWQGVLLGITAAQIMQPDCPVIAPEVTINRLVNGYILTGGHRCFLVANADQLTGVLTLENIKLVNQAKREHITAQDIMTPISRLRVISPDQDAMSVLEQMDENAVNQLPVVSDGRVIGLVTRERLIGLLRTRTELKI